MSYGLHRRGAWRSLVSALVWGTKGRRFESGRPDEISVSRAPIPDTPEPAFVAGPGE